MGSLSHERRTGNSPLLLTNRGLDELYKKNVHRGLGQSRTGNEKKGIADDERGSAVSGFAVSEEMGIPHECRLPVTHPMEEEAAPGASSVTMVYETDSRRAPHRHRGSDRRAPHAGFCMETVFLWKSLHKLLAKQNGGSSREGAGGAP